MQARANRKPAPKWHEAGRAYTSDTTDPNLDRRTGTSPVPRVTRSSCYITQRGGAAKMSFAIEVPGEATPLSLFELGKALEAGALSTDHAQRQSASQQLQAWETQPEYFSTLQTVFLDKSLRIEIRLLAIICIKNGIDKYWRHTAKHAIKPPEKQLMRSRLLQGSVDEPDRTLALHNALAVAKIVRIDYPDHWPDAMQIIINVTRSAQNGNPAHLGGALLVLLRVVKELSTARIRRIQTSLQAVTPELVQLLGQIYTEKTAYWQEFFMKGRGDEDDADYAMQNSLTALKILRRLVTFGYDNPHTDNMVQGFWSLSQNQFDQFLNGVSHDSWIPAPFQDLVGKHLIQFTKLHIDMCEQHPHSFPALPNSIPLVNAYWNLVKEFSDVFEKSGGIKETASRIDGGNPKHEGPLSEKLALKGLLLLRSCVAIAYRPVQTFKYRSPETKELEKAAQETIKTQLLTSNLLLDIVQVIISKLFIFRKSDLDAWEEDPEEWESQERSEGQAYEWAVRPCAERLLIDLLTHYKELGQPLLTYCELATKVDMDIVTKEAAYTALGCAAAIVRDTFDFDRFLNNTLVKDAQIDDPMAKLLRRRIAILLSQWISVKVGDSSRPTVYEIYRHLMNPNDKHNDEVVRITAARQLKYIADEFEFNSEAFLPYAGDMFTLLIKLLDEVSSDEVKLAILNTMRSIIERMESSISPFGDMIMGMLPKLWESAASEEYMIKQSALAIMAALVMSMRGDSRRYQDAIVPLLREAMNPDSPLHLHLIEDSVYLWKSVLEQSSRPLHPELTQMVQLALPLVEYDTEVSAQCQHVVRYYILLAPQEMLSDNFRRPTLAALAKALDLSSREQMENATKSIELIIAAGEALGGVQGVSVIVQDMLEIGLLKSIMEGLHSLWEASQSTGPNKKTTRLITNTQELDYYALLARICLADPGVFVQMLAGFGTVGLGTNDPVKTVWSWLGTQWFAKFDAIADVERQKLSLLAMTRLLELPDMNMQEYLTLARLQDFLSMWTSVLTRLADGSTEDDVNRRDCLVWGDNSASFDYDTPIDVYEREAVHQDLIHKVPAYEFVQVRLHDLVRRAGGEQAFEANWAVNVDKEVLEGFQSLFTIL
ncbi:armadillo-type protein [Diplogelasinospora grovesii]|uniref:Armadillo-type protein n=1 Tax=Diplogelasinospora grovesii TaxID=303347 RepID=A0AAN6N8D9_9PEZI|nr:armadillo-type protein [Diplogelasinospora grovesii]